MGDAVFNIGRSSLLVAALSAGRLDLIRHAMRDRLHQPYRAPLIPGMAEVLEGAVDHGALGAALSGAGPALLALVESDSGRLEELKSFMSGTLSRAGVECDLMLLAPDPSGPAVWMEAENEGLPFLQRIKGDLRA